MPKRPQTEKPSLPPVLTIGLGGRIVAVPLTHREHSRRPGHTNPINLVPGPKAYGLKTKVMSYRAIEAKIMDVTTQIGRLERRISRGKSTDHDRLERLTGLRDRLVDDLSLLVQK